MKLLLSLFACCCILLSNIVIAAVPTWQIIPAQSELTFTATQNGAPVTGKFTKFTGDIQFDAAHLNASHARIVVEVGSVATSYDELTSTLTSSDWFGVQTFPQAIFVADHFTKTADNMYQADGKLTVRDKTLPVTVTFKMTDLPNNTVRAQGSTKLKRNAFGVGQGEWADTSEVKDDVTVNFIMTAIKK
jgi:polyisoprenoid-binding protein YceI